MAELIRTFVRHPVAPNLMLLVMLIAGLWASSKLTRQLLPAFSINVVTVQVDWPGAAAEDVESSLTQPLEDALIGLQQIRGLNSTSRVGASSVNIEYAGDVDMGAALDQVKNAVAQVRNLPISAEEPEIALLDRNESVARIVLTGGTLESMRPLVKSFERELRGRGLSRLEIAGLPREEISIEVSPLRLSELNLSLQDIADRIGIASVDVPAGSIGSRDVARQLRSEDQARSAEDFRRLPVSADGVGRLLKLGDIATVRRQAISDEMILFADGEPAIEVVVSRLESEDALDIAEKLNAWIAEVRPQLPANVELLVYDEIWRTVDERIDLMFSNALSGLVLVMVVLFLFLNARVAFWVGVGIPASILAALVALYLFGGSINVMTLFAMIMTFGIIVDDAIVVGEEAVTRFQAGEGAETAAEGAAIRMFAPVTAASLTTIAAFLPLVTIGGPTGSILFAVPLVVICVVLASLAECFLVLPGHLRHSLAGTAKNKKAAWRRQIDVGMNKFRQNYIRPGVRWSVNNRRTCAALAFGGFIVMIGLLAGGRVGFAFFPQPDGTTISANARFVAGSPPERMEQFLGVSVKALRDIEQESGEQFIRLIVARQNETTSGDKGPHVGQITVELSNPEDRSLSNQEVISQWTQRVTAVPGLEYFLIQSSRGGVPGSDIDVALSGASADTLKRAALDLQNSLSEFTGVTAIRDDLAFGKEQLIFELSPTGRAIGFNGQSLGSQLRANFEGELVQSFQDAGDEVEVRVRLAESERESLRALESLPVLLPDGETAALSNVATLSYGRGFDDLKHNNGLLAVRVTADIDSSKNNANAVRAILARDVMPQIAERYGVDWRFGGKAEDQSESVGDIALALPISLLTIYIILAWVLGSYSWPLAVMSIIPFGLVGAIFGHWLLGFDVTMMSLFGFFGLSGIVINDSIILTVVFKDYRAAGLSAKDAAVEAACDRLRAVLLTSVTTIVGILPLLFETNLQAQFLKPMVVALTFGLLFGTVLVLFLLPVLLSGIETLRTYLASVKSGVRSYVPGFDSVVGAGNPRKLTLKDPMAEPGSGGRGA